MHICVQGREKARRGYESRRAGVVGCCEVPDMNVWVQTLVLKIEHNYFVVVLRQGFYVQSWLSYNAFCKPNSRDPLLLPPECWLKVMYHRQTGNSKHF